MIIRKQRRSLLYRPEIIFFSVLLAGPATIAGLLDTVFRFYFVSPIYWKPIYILLILYFLLSIVGFYRFLLSVPSKYGLSGKARLLLVGIFIALQSLVMQPLDYVRDVWAGKEVTYTGACSVERIYRGKGSYWSCVLNVPRENEVVSLETGSSVCESLAPEMVLQSRIQKYGDCTSQINVTYLKDTKVIISLEKLPL